MGTTALIGLGSNLGDRKAHLDFAVASLSKTPGIEVRAISMYHETSPVGGPRGQGAFLNAATAVDTSLEPETLLDRLNAIEHESGRVRTEHWGERTLDLDLLLFGELITEAPRLTIPHPQMVVRRFVLAPLAEITPDAIEPITGLTVASLLANLDRRPSYVALFRHRNDEKAIFRRITEGLSAVGLSTGSENGAGDELKGGWCWQENAESSHRLLEQIATELRPDRWSADVWGDRWMVTDFWFDRIHGLARSMMPSSEFAPFHERFLQLQENVVVPTFLVLERRIEAFEIQGYFRGDDSPSLRPVVPSRPSGL